MNDLLLNTLLSIPVLIFNSYITLKVYHWGNKRREMKFLKHLKILYPDGDILLSTVATSDHKALEMLKAQLDER